MEEPLLNSWFKRTFSRVGKGSVRAGIIVLTTSAMGSGIFSIPYAIKNSGVISGSLMIIISAITFARFYRVLIKAQEVTKETSYVAIVATLYGAKWRRIIEFSILLNIFGSMCAYQSLIVNCLTDFIRVFGPSCEGVWFYLFNLMIMGTVSILSIPKSLTKLRYVCLGSILSMIYVTFVVIFESIDIIPKQNLEAEVVYFKTDLAAVNSMSIIMFSFCAITILPIVYEELNYRSYRRGIKIIDRSLMIVSLVYMLMGVLGYLSYLDQVPSLIINRNTQDLDWPMVIAKGILSFTLIANYLSSLHPLRQAAYTCFCGFEKEINEVNFYVLNYVLILLVGLMATIFPDVVNYFTFLGGFGIVMIVIIVPTLLDWKVSRRPYLMTLVCVILSTAGFTSAVLTIIGY